MVWSLGGGFDVTCEFQSLTRVQQGMYSVCGIRGGAKKPYFLERLLTM